MDTSKQQLETAKIEGKWYKFWEENGFFKPEINPEGEPYCIIMPPPNANESLHIGHARFVAIEDTLIRYARMQGKAALWQPGTDHAGIETQYVFEKKLAKEGKSRFDYDHRTLYQIIWDYTQGFRGVAISQMKKLGASADWDREKYTLDPDVVKLVKETFAKLFRNGLIERKEALVNYCTSCGTSYSELEVDHIDEQTEIFTIDYGTIKIATTRPETIFADVAVAVHPDDPRYKDLPDGAFAVIPLINQRIPIIKDARVNPDFGTGAVKITPAHDKLDFEIGKDHGLEIIQILDESGRLKNLPRVPERYRGLKIKAARELMIGELALGGKMIGREQLVHSIGVCYRCKNVIEPMVSIQWFLKVKSLAEKAYQAVKSGKTKFVSGKYAKIYNHWLKNLRDWNISRQIVWGIRMPIWYQIDNPSKFYVKFVDKNGSFKQNSLNYFLEDEQIPFEEIETGLISIQADPKTTFVLEEDKDPKKRYLQEAYTFDTWFSSGQWPYICLKANSEEDFKRFYPTGIMETGYDILPFWVVRMMMLGPYATGKVPFKTILLHGLVRDAKGEKISKSKGNVIDPLEMADKFGTDALRMSLVWGALVENDVVLSEDNIRGQRNFTNKLWNIGRYIVEFKPKGAKSLVPGQLPEIIHKDDEWIVKELYKTVGLVTKALETYKLNSAAESIYEFIWHVFADKYIEKSKERRCEAQSVLEYVFRTSLELLHPFMPFITEELWQMLPHSGRSIMLASWPKES